MVDELIADLLYIIIAEEEYRRDENNEEIMEDVFTRLEKLKEDIGEQSDYSFKYRFAAFFKEHVQPKWQQQYIVPSEETLFILNVFVLFRG